MEWPIEGRLVHVIYPFNALVLNGGWSVLAPELPRYILHQAATIKRKRPYSSWITPLTADLVSNIDLPTQRASRFLDCVSRLTNLLSPFQSTTDKNCRLERYTPWLRPDSSPSPCTLSASRSQPPTPSSAPLPSSSPKSSSPSSASSPYHRRVRRMSVSHCHGSLPSVKAEVLQLTHPPPFQALRTLMLMIGARDWSIAAAMFYFWLRGEAKNMGIVILSGMTLCLVDLWVIACRRGGDAVSWGLGVGVALWAAVGLGLLDA